MSIMRAELRIREKHIFKFPVGLASTNGVPTIVAFNEGRFYFRGYERTGDADEVMGEAAYIDRSVFPVRVGVKPNEIAPWRVISDSPAVVTRIILRHDGRNG